ncbi:MAG: branched-chain amino acid transaminase [Candidatus Micrarchaeota archaeon]
MKTARFIWLDGRLVPWKNAQVHFLTHALHYGTGIFEGIRCYSGKPNPMVFRLDEHLKRLEQSANTFGIKLPYPVSKIKQAIVQTVKKNKLRQCYIRPLIYYGYGEMGLNPLSNPVQMGIAAWPWEHYLGPDAFEKGIHVKISSWVRNNPDALPPKAKISGAYANSVLAKTEAIREGFMDAILLDDEGYVAEGTGENVFIAVDGTLYSPLLNNCLAGITRKSVIEIAKELKIPFADKQLTREEIYNADEVFFTGTAAELTPITKMDYRKIGNGKVGPITKKIQEYYTGIVHGKNPKFKNWLTPVK